MKRKELLEKNQEKEVKIDAASIVKKDKISINNLIGKKELEEMEADEAITEYLANPKLSLDGQFLNLKRNLNTVQSDITLLKAIKEEYL